MKKIVIPVEFTIGTLDDVGMSGFQIEWLFADSDTGTRYELTAGAGCGNTRLEARARKNGTYRYAVTDIESLAQQLFGILSRELETPGA